MDAWRLIQNNAIETRNKDVKAMIDALKAIASRNACAWQHLTGAAWARLSETDRAIVTVLQTRIEAGE